MSEQGGEPDPFGRREAGDPFESMREQMEKERENFFRGVNPRDWPNDSTTSRGGLFNRPRTSLGGFPTAGGLRGPRYVNDFPAAAADELEGFGGLPGSQARQRMSSQCGPEDEGSDHSSSSGQSQGLEQESVPINVHHEARGGPRHKYNTQRNTTELPAKASGGSESPRLERAASEPPNKFTQRLNLSKPCYNTIPEGGEGVSSRPNQLQDPRGPEPTRPGSIKPSASAPSVPTHESQPVPPPRRSPPRPGGMAGQGVPTNSAGNVRHIPIFVEGRPEPIFNTNIKVHQPEQQQEPSGEPAFSKPSDYYPQGVQRVKNRDATLTPETPHFQGEPFKSGRQVVPMEEPTTPQGPPPGPIPMGYIPVPEEPKEPTTPLGPPPGPIPMGYLPTNASSQDPIPVPPPPPQRQRVLVKEQLVVPTPEGDPVNGGTPLEAKRRSPSPNPTAANHKTRTLDKERKTSAEPVVNVVPIRVEGARSRGTSQEPRPGKSPTPARTTPQPPVDTPTPPVNPKQAKLDKINDEVEALRVKISSFSGKKQDKEYLYLDEMLTRHLIALDGIEPEGQVEIRQMRKESIKSVNMCLSLLDEKSAAPS